MAINNGLQVLDFQYKEAAQGRTFNSTGYKINARGIYSGGIITKNSDTSISLSPMVVYFEDTTNILGVKISTTTLAIINSITPTTPFICGRFSWSDLTGNYMTFIAVQYSDIIPTDIIFGKLQFTGSVMSTQFDYSKKTWSYNYYENINNYYPPFKVEATEPYSNQVQVYPGDVWYGNSEINLNIITNSPSFTLPVTSGRIDFICIDTASTLQIVKGVDNSSPVNPIIPFNYVPLAKVTFPLAASTIIGTYINNIYDKDYKPNFNLGLNWQSTLSSGLFPSWPYALTHQLSSTFLGPLVSGLGSNWPMTLTSGLNTIWPTILNQPITNVFQGQKTLLTAIGAGTYTVPSGVFQLRVTCVGGGGNGGNGGSSIGGGGGAGGGGGGGGGTNISIIIASILNVTPGQVINYSVGGAGTQSTFTGATTGLAGSNGTSGTTGNPSGGGIGGSGPNNIGQAGGSGGGGTGINTTNYGGNGGNGGGNGGVGGTGGNGVNVVGTNGTNGNYGGGGGGGGGGGPGAGVSGGSGGSGGQGIIIVEY